MNKTRESKRERKRESNEKEVWKCQVVVKLNREKSKGRKKEQLFVSQISGEVRGDR